MSHNLTYLESSRHLKSCLDDGSASILRATLLFGEPTAENSEISSLEVIE
jgi:hypothetical protein